MDTSKYWAKSDKVTTLVIHNAALREALDKLYELGYIEKDVQDKVKKQQKVLQGGRLEKDW